MSIAKPRLRYVEVIPIEQEGEMVVVLRDPEQLSGQLMAVPLPTFMIMALMDGTRDMRDVQVDIQRRFEQLLPVEHLEKLVEQLDEFFLLENERSLIRREDLVRDFARMPVRPAVHAGAAYPAGSAELIKLFDGFFEPLGDGDRPEPGRMPRGLVVPHIDIRRGGPCMARAFHQLRGPEPPECYIVLGVAHQPTPNLYTLTDKDFETPLGAARVNQDAAARLKELYGEERLTGEYAHKFEHSVEFQAVFLKYLHRDDHDFTILPILCGSLEEELTKDAAPRDRADVGEFCAALEKLIDELGPRVCVIAGVDLSHVGKKFGDADGVDDFRAGLVRAADMRMLDCVKECDPEAFFNHFREDGNARKVDAISAVYSMLHTLGPGEAQLLNYDQHRETETESMVTFASMAIY
ncbi:AmmeMemoRadiSam system protein B [Candidatus Sumerlaeota bacterium]|nr:AmmeMemoRadiSam system protein B [Candidatus Sumerlaeota bacterium]